MAAGTRYSAEDQSPPCSANSTPQQRCSHRPVHKALFCLDSINTALTDTLYIKIPVHIDTLSRKENLDSCGGELVKLQLGKQDGGGLDLEL